MATGSDGIRLTTATLRALTAAQYRPFLSLHYQHCFFLLSHTVWIGCRIHAFVCVSPYIFSSDAGMGSLSSMAEFVMKEHTSSRQGSMQSRRSTQAISG
jgi:hypothetical protein